MLQNHAPPAPGENTNIPDLPQGLVRFIQTGEHLCLVDVTAEGLERGATFQLEIHASGDTRTGALSCGPVFNPGDGDKESSGILGTFIAGSKGWGDLLVESNKIDLSELVGRSVILTQLAESRSTTKQPGLVKESSICGIIARSAGAFHNTKKICACSGKTLWQEARIPQKL